MHLPVDAKNLIDMFVACGFDAYAVGGFVRDSIMERDCGDIDITTSATPQEIEAVLDKNDIRYIETGLKHGTITAVVDHIPYEITTFRRDGQYNDNRHPDDVRFVRDISEDLARRDFTINAIAYNDIVGVVDLYGGIGDINAGLIRAVGDADTRFKEDALRIMRALRFSSVLGFDIEDSTAKAIFDNKLLLRNIAQERLFSELRKLLLGDNVVDVLLKYRDVIAVIIPELVPCFDFPQNTKWHIYDVYEHIVRSVAETPKSDYMRLAMLLHDIGKPFCRTTDVKGQDHFKGHPKKSVEIASVVLRRLKVSNDMYNKVVTLIEYHDMYIRTERANIKWWLRTLGYDMTLDYIDFKIADQLSHNLDLSQSEIDVLRSIKGITKEIVASGEPYRVSDLAVSGRDLASLGYVGKGISTELEKLITVVSSYPEFNNKSDLISIAKNDMD